MLLNSSLGCAHRACNTLPGYSSRRVRIGRVPPRQPSTARRQLVVCYKEHGSTPPPSHDLDWAHVSRDVKTKVSQVAGSNKQMMEQLQSWLSEAKLAPLGESEEEEGANQTEMVAQLEGDNMELADYKVDVNSWLGGEGEEDETASKMAGVLTLRLLQVYHKNTGEPFDDDSDDCYWRLQGLIPGGLVEALDHDTLRRLIRGYALIPFSGA